MRPISPRLIERLRCADPTARVLCEAQAELRSDVLKTKSDLQSADGFTARAQDFPTTNVLDAAAETTEVTLTNAPAGNHLYEAHFKVTITPIVPGAGSNTHKVVVAVEIDAAGAGSWVEQFNFEYELIRKTGEPATAVTWPNERLPARVPALTSASKLRLKIKSASGPGGWSFAVHGFNLATDGDPLSGVTYHTGPAIDFLDSGGASLADTVVSKLSHGTSDQTETDLNGPPFALDAAPFMVARIVWGKDDSRDIALDRIKAFLNPDVDGVPGNKTVVWFLCQVYALAESGIPYEGGDPGLFGAVDLIPLGDAIRIPAGEGTSAQDYTFTWHERSFTGPGHTIITLDRKPRPKSVQPKFHLHSQPTEYDSSPTSFVFIWALKADGTAATNVGWARNSAVTEVVNGSRKLRTVRITRDEVNQRWLAEMPVTSGVDPLRPVFRMEVQCGSYAAANLEFTTGGNQIDVGATPTETVEFVAVAAVPSGTGSVFEVRNDADSAWLPFTDGQSAAEVGVSQRQTYKVRWRGSPNAETDATPVLWEIGVRDVKKVWLSDLATVKAKWSIPDVAELVPAIPEAEITVLKNGEQDFRDRISVLLSENYVGSLLFRVWVGDPARPRSEWMHKDDFVLVDDYDPDETSITIVAHSALVLLNGALPIYNATTEQRAALLLANKTPKQIWDEIVGNQLAPDVPARYRGDGLTDQSCLLTKTITDSDGKTELDAAAHVAGVVLGTSGGRIRQFDFTTPGSIKAFFPAEKQKKLTARPGLRQRVPEFFVLYDYSEEEQRYRGEARLINGNALLNLKTGRIDPRPLRDEVSRWIPTELTAKRVGQRRVDWLGTGMLVWPFTSTDPYPELEFGDLVAVETTKFVARDPMQTTLRALKGALWAVGRVVSYDVEGRELAIWVQSYADLLGSSEVGTRLGFAAPDISSLALSIGSTQQVTLTVGCLAGSSVRVATSTAAFPSMATVEAASPVVLDAQGNAVIDLGALATLATMYVSAIPYEGAAGSGSKGLLRQAQITAPAVPSTVQVVAVVPTSFADSTTDHLVPMAATVVPGELLLIVFGSTQAGGGAPTTPSGWTSLRTENTPSTNRRLTVYGKVASGTEGGTTVNIVTPGACTAAALAYRVTQWFGGLAGVENAVAEGSAIDPNPPNLSPSWAANRNLWFAIYISNGVEGGSVPPTGYTMSGNDEVGDTVGGTVEVGAAHQLLYASAEDPGIFDRTVGSEWVAITLAVQPPA